MTPPMPLLQVALVVEVEAMGHLGPHKTELLILAVVVVVLKPLGLEEQYPQQAVQVS